MAQTKDVFSKDPRRAQQISGGAAVSAIVITVLIITAVPLNTGVVINVMIIGFLTAIFTAVYYLTPKIYANPKYNIIPDIAYIAATIFVMKNLSAWSYLYIIFFIIIIAVDAFTESKKNFVTVVSLVVMGLIYASLPVQEELRVFVYRIIFEIYGILTISIILRLYAKEALDQKEKKEELESLNKHLQTEKKEIKTLFDNVSEIMISVDAKNKVVLINKAALNYFHLGEDTKKSKLEASLNFVSPKGIINFKELIPLNRKAYFRNDLKLITKKDTKKFYTSVTPLYDENDDYTGTIIFMHDATKEEELEKKKEEFAAITSHELRTPLTVIEGYLHFLLSNDSLNYDEETKRYLSIIHDSTLELIKLSKDILLTTKSEAGTLELLIEKTDLISLFKEVAKEYSSKINKKRIKITIDAKEKTLQLKTDKGKAKEILINLLDNAIKFTKKGSITVSILKTEEEAIFSIKDTGIGIPIESQKLIFQKFYRAEDWQTRATGGSGLGLYISKTLAERLGGQINFKSKQGEGSLFVLSLPLTFSSKKRKAINKNSSDTLKN